MMAGEIGSGARSPELEKAQEESEERRNEKRENRRRIHRFDMKYLRPGVDVSPVCPLLYLSIRVFVGFLCSVVTNITRFLVLACFYSYPYLVPLKCCTLAPSPYRILGRLGLSL